MQMQSSFQEDTTRVPKQARVRTYRLVRFVCSQCNRPAAWSYFGEPMCRQCAREARVSA